MADSLKRHVFTKDSLPDVQDFDCGDEPHAQEVADWLKRPAAPDHECALNSIADPDKPGRFRLQFGKMIFNMAPEPTTTGAVRLEDKKAGVVWLQIPTKSMLMNYKVGQRRIDFCMNSAQSSEAQSAALAGAQADSAPRTPAPTTSPAALTEPVAGASITPELPIKQ